MQDMNHYISCVSNVMMPGRDEAMFTTELTRLAVAPVYKYCRLASNPLSLMAPTETKATSKVSLKADAPPDCLADVVSSLSSDKEASL